LADEPEKSEEVLARLKKLEDILKGLRQSQDENIKEMRQLKELNDRVFLALFKREQRLIESHCPNVFLFYPVQTEWYKKPFTKQKMGLHLCCQAPNEWHYAYRGYERVGYYEFEVAADWLVKMAPYLKMLFRVVQLATPFFHASFGVSRADMEQEWSHHVNLMNSLLTHLPAMDGAEFDDMEGLDRLAEDSLRGLRFEATGAALRQIRALLDEQDPTREWGGLRKVLTPEGHYFWLCEYHAAQYR
jgi:internalin A